jgi:hypothetical protein
VPATYKKVRGPDECLHHKSDCNWRMDCDWNCVQYGETYSEVVDVPAHSVVDRTMRTCPVDTGIQIFKRDIACTSLINGVNAPVAHSTLPGQFKYCSYVDVAGKRWKMDDYLVEQKRLADLMTDAARSSQ